MIFTLNSKRMLRRVLFSFNTYNGISGNVFPQNTLTKVVSDCNLPIPLTNTMKKKRDFLGSFDYVWSDRYLTGQKSKQYVLNLALYCACQLEFYDYDFALSFLFAGNV